jgi:hypothetical protein
MSGLEDPGNAKENGGMFEKGILKAMESDHRANGNALEVKVITNGHCHGEFMCTWECYSLKHAHSYRKLSSC